MRQSTERMLTTHVGSLARPHALLETMREKEHGRPYDAAHFAEQVRAAVTDVVHKQAACGLDVLTDGEQGKVTFATYVNERLGGFDTKAGESLMPASWRVEAEAFPEYYQAYFGKYKDTVSPMRVMVCNGPVSYEGHDAVQADIANLKKALAEVDAVEGFLPATSPKGFGRNEYYGSEEEYLHAVAEALREEYQAIVDSGLLLQIDDPWMIEILSDPNSAPQDRLRQVEQHIEALNHALRGIPQETIRLHTCYGLNHGPRVHDLAMRDVAPYMLKINAGAYSFEVANPRHAHEWKIWQDIKLPEGKVLIPGFLSHSISFVEHPELIADGIETYAKVVGRENVIAGADCGYSSRATFQPEVDPRIVWEKFCALAEGAALATKRLWS